MTHHLLQTSDTLGLDYKNDPVFSDIACELGKGELLLLSGPNGSGKTALLEVLAGRRQPTRGTVEYATPMPSICYVPANSTFLRWRSVSSVLRLWAKTHDTMLAVVATIEYLQLDFYLSQPVRYLSDGWKARLSLAKLMLSPAELWALDAPIARLDETGRHMLAGLLAGHLRKGGAAMLTAMTEGDIQPWLPKDAKIIHINMQEALKS